MKYASLPSPQHAGDRRESGRHLMVLQLGILEAAGELQLGLILDLGSGGLRFRLFREMALPEMVTVRIKGGQAIAAWVAWQDGHLAGLAFEHALDDAELRSMLQSLITARGPRLQTDLKIMVRNGAEVLPAVLKNISPRGAGIAFFGDARLSFREIRLSVPGLGTIAGQVCWQHSGHAGIAFNDVVSLRHLAAGIKANGIS